MTPADSSAAVAVTTAPPVAPIATADKPVRLRFVGSRRDYWRLMIRGNALQGVTLGLYRFWLFTDMRRSLWAGIELEDENFEYTGTALELLGGFLMALAILIPLEIGSVFLLLASGDLELAGLFFVFTYAIGQFAWFRARAYRLTRTVLRGLRFHQTGSGIVFAIRAVLWWALTLLTLGLAYPFMVASQERYQMSNTYFGDLGGSFEGSGWRLLVRGIAMWIVIVPQLVFALATAGQELDLSAIGNLLLAQNVTNIWEAVQQLGNLQSAGAITGIALTWALVFALILWPALAAIVLRWWLDGIRLGGAAVVSDLRIRDFYGAYVRCLLYQLLFTLAFVIAGGLAAIMIIGVLSGVIDFSVVSTPRDAVLALMGIVAYVVFVLGCSAIYQVVVRFRVWQLMVDSITVSGIAALDNVRARPAHANALGEGLADALGTGSV
jgi:hypothetical protein